MPKAHVQKLFATPMLVSQVTDPELNSALEATIMQKRAEDPGVLRSNRGGGWHSDLHIMDWGGQPAKRLRNTLVSIVNEHTHDSSANGPPAGWLVEGWANVNEKGGSNMRHVHGGAFWSAVYYVRVDEGVGGELVVHDPRMPTLAMYAPYLRFKDTGGERFVRVQPRPGLLVVFPSWLEHEVDPWESDGIRISIALNLCPVRGQVTLKKAPSKARPEAAPKSQSTPEG